jgi:hypothetical protein
MSGRSEERQATDEKVRAYKKAMDDFEVAEDEAYETMRGCLPHDERRSRVSPLRKSPDPGPGQAKRAGGACRVEGHN